MNIEFIREMGILAARDEKERGRILDRADELYLRMKADEKLQREQVKESSRSEGLLNSFWKRYFA